MTTAEVKLPPKLIPVFLGEARYRGAYGGRGSGKSRSFALMTAVRGFMAPTRILCCREIQNSIKDSVHAEIASAIRSYPWLEEFYEIGQSYIRGKNGTEYLFKGLRHGYDEIKSTSGIGICWVEEAEAVSEQSWSKLIPTIREKGSEIWLTWNPESADSSTSNRFIHNPPDNSKIVLLNHSDNPWFPDELAAEMVRDYERDPDYAAHIWEGDFLTRTDAQVFAGKWTVRDFTPEADWDGPYFGMDFGFSVDPTAVVKCWVHDETLYIEKEWGGVGIDLDLTWPGLREVMPEMGDYTVRADSARPESISFLRRNGIPRMIGATKGKGSVEHGISHLRSFKAIVIHSNCVECAREFRLYSYKVDRLSGDVLPVLIDANNHYVDALRYALEPLAGIGLGAPKSAPAPQPERDMWGKRTIMRGSVWTS